MSKAAFLGLFIGAALPAFSQQQAAAPVQVPSTASTVAPVNQRRVDPAAMYHRVYAVVPMIGTGQKGDPFRPMFAPLASEIKNDHTGILGFQMQASDDGKFALVEFVAATRQELLSIITSNAPGVAVFERGLAAQADIETAFQKYKKDFKMSLFNTRAQ